MTRYTVVTISTVCALLILLVLAIPAAAGPVVVDPFAGKDFGVFGAVSPATGFLDSPYNYGGTFVGNVYSQTFSLSSGDYLYIYQAANAGPAIFELMGMAPIRFAEAGFLTGGEPAGFLTGGKTPFKYGENYGVMYDKDALLLTYNYNSFFGSHLSAGEHTVALYLLSPHGPTMGETYLIDGGVATADIWIPVPEPTSMLVLASGLAGLGVLRRRRR